MIIQLFKKDKRVLLLDGIKDYELGKHHSTFISNEGIVEAKISMYDYMTVQLEAKDLEEETDSHVPHQEKKIGFTHEESQGEPEVPDDEDYEWSGI